MGKRTSVRAVEPGTPARVGARNALLQPKQSPRHASDQGFDNTQDVPRQGNAGISDLPANSTLGHSFSQIAVHPPIQAKLTVGAPNDKYEQEADRVADTVMRMPDPVVQRQEETEEEEREKEEEKEVMETKLLVGEITPLAQRQVNEVEEEEKPEEEKEKLLQPKARPGKVPTVPSDLEAKINRMHGHSGSLPT
ncbi:MAG: hypothetical protein ACYTG0_21615, partial [Planctomycetota bacterium]